MLYIKKTCEKMCAEVSFNIYPTVVTIGFTVEFYSRLAPTCTLDIYSVSSGSKVYTTKMNTNKCYVNIDSLPPGTYIVRLGNMTCKIIKL